MKWRDKDQFMRKEKIRHVVTEKNNFSIGVSTHNSNDLK